MWARVLPPGTGPLVGLCVLGVDGMDAASGLIVDVAVIVADEDVVVRCATGRKFAWLGVVALGDSIAVPSNGPGDARSRRLVGVIGPSSSLSSFLLPWTSPPSPCRDDIASPLNGLANRLDGRSPVWLLICDGRRTKGLAFSGDSDPTVLVEEKADAGGLVGEEALGVEARTVVAGDAELWRRKGDCRPLPGSAKERGRDWGAGVIPEISIQRIWEG